MIRKSQLVLFVVMALVLTASVASAANMRWGAQAWGSWNTFSMSDWNTAIDAANASGSNFDNINNGFAFGGGPTVMVNENWQFGVHYERLIAKKSEDQGTEVKPAANAFGVSGGYWFPSHSQMNLGIGASVDYMKLAGTLSDPTTSLDIHGSGVGGEVMGMANWGFTPMFAGNFGAGYRFAKINIDDIGGQSTAGSGFDSEDYSGLSLRAGISLTQPASHK
jgi:hypothetical protein